MNCMAYGLSKAIDKPVGMQRENAPSLGALAREMAYIPVMRMVGARAPAVPLPRARRPRKVMVLPGFMAGDRSMSRLTRSLRVAGHDAFGWGLGRNMGVRADLFSRLAEQLDLRTEGEPIALVGWSLGGLMAREFAKHASCSIDKVLTLGSPFSGDLRRSNHVWRIYRHIAGHDVERLPISVDLPRKPAAETIAFWSPRDGVISARAARGHPGERDREVRVECSHMAFVWDEAVIRSIGEALHS